MFNFFLFLFFLKFMLNSKRCLIVALDTLTYWCRKVQSPKCFDAQKASDSNQTYASNSPASNKISYWPCIFLKLVLISYLFQHFRLARSKTYTFFFLNFNLYFIVFLILFIILVHTFFFCSEMPSILINGLSMEIFAKAGISHWFSLYFM